MILAFSIFCGIIRLSKSKRIIPIINGKDTYIELRREKFGFSSEKTTAQIAGQLSLFNEAEVEADENTKEPFHERKGGIVRKYAKTKREELLKDLPIEEAPCMIHPDDMFCVHCGSGLKEIGYVKVRDELEYIPAKVKIIRYM